MKEPDWLFDEHWIDWRIVPALTLGEAAYLLAGADPAEARNNRVPSSRVEALRTALEASVRTGDLVPFELWGFDFDGGLVPLKDGDPIPGGRLSDQTTVKASDLAAWADARGVEHFWPGGGATVNMPARDMSRYPAELRAAIEAFEAVFNDPKATAGKSPRAALLAWLESNQPELGSNARERIATVANWQPAGGAPKTPGG